MHQIGLSTNLNKNIKDFRFRGGGNRYIFKGNVQHINIYFMPIPLNISKNVIIWSQMIKMFPFFVKKIRQIVKGNRQQKMLFKYTSDGHKVKVWNIPIWSQIDKKMIFNNWINDMIVNISIYMGRRVIQRNVLKCSSSPFYRFQSLSYLALRGHLQTKMKNKRMPDWLYSCTEGSHRSTDMVLLYNAALHRSCITILREVTTTLQREIAPRKNDLLSKMFFTFFFLKLD